MSGRSRTLGCYPLAAAIESGTATLPEAIRRAIDHGGTGAVERKKKEGCF